MTIDIVVVVDQENDIIIIIIDIGVEVDQEKGIEVDHENVDQDEKEETEDWREAGTEGTGEKDNTVPPAVVRKRHEMKDLRVLIIRVLWR